jgi:hypothetical protein
MARPERQLQLCIVRDFNAFFPLTKRSNGLASPGVIFSTALADTSVRPVKDASSCDEEADGEASEEVSWEVCVESEGLGACLPFFPWVAPDNGGKSSALSSETERGAGTRDVSSPVASLGGGATRAAAMFAEASTAHVGAFDRVAMRSHMAFCSAVTPAPLAASRTAGLDLDAFGSFGCIVEQPAFSCCYRPLDRFSAGTSVEEYQCVGRREKAERLMSKVRTT